MCGPSGQSGSPVPLSFEPTPKNSSLKELVPVFGRLGVRDVVVVRHDGEAFRRDGVAICTPARCRPCPRPRRQGGHGVGRPAPPVLRQEKDDAALRATMPAPAQHRPSTGPAWMGRTLRAGRPAALPPSAAVAVLALGLEQVAARLCDERSWARSRGRSSPSWSWHRSTVTPGTAEPRFADLVKRPPRAMVTQEWLLV